MSNSRNVALAIDLLKAFLQAAQRTQELLQKAEMEGRDVSKEEIDELSSETDRLRKRWDGLAPKD